MKTLSGFLLIVTVLFFPAAEAQSQDTALARIDTKEVPKKTDKPFNKDLKSSENLSVENEEVVPQVKFIVPERRDRTSDILDTKAGPNGEDIQMDKQGYYYLNEDGKKVRIDSKALRDKPKHS